MKKLLLTLSCAVFNLTAYSAVPLTPEQQLGEALFKDKNLSFNHIVAPIVQTKKSLI
jgi:hypothetical protein